MPEEVWSSVEEGLVPAADKAVNWLDAKTAIAKIAKDYNICVAGGACLPSNQIHIYTSRVE